MDSTKIHELLNALISGRLSIHEGRARAHEAGFASVFELCEGRALPPRLPKVHLLPQRIAKVLAQTRSEEIPLEEARLWLEEFAQIADCFKLGQGVSETAHDALTLASVVADGRVFRGRVEPNAVFEELESALRKRAPLEIAKLYGRLFHDQPELNFAARWLDPSEPQFMADLVALASPWSGQFEDNEWVAAACLITRGLAAGQGSQGWSVHAAGSELAKGRSDLGLSGVRVDPDGVLELEFARDTIGEAEAKAGALFLAELWRVPRVSLFGELLLGD
jgi:hypothetical protein